MVVQHHCIHISFYIITDIFCANDIFIFQVDHVNKKYRFGYGLQLGVNPIDIPN
jgi:hypothetical protein